MQDHKTTTNMSQDPHLSYLRPESINVLRPDAVPTASICYY